MEIINGFLLSFNRVEFMYGPQKGPAANFFSLLRKSTSKYVALADQDDIWNPDHLINSIKELKLLDSSPAMRFSSTYQFGTKVAGSTWPKTAHLQPVEKLLVENQARGCTIVLNKRAVDLINLYEPRNAVMHDWWILIQISLRGTVIYCPHPEVLYRIHDSNSVGLPKKRGLKALRSARSGTWPPMLQAEELLMINKTEISINLFETIESFVNIPNLNFFSKLKTTLLKPQRFRSNLIDEIAIRFVLFFYKNSA
jgi:glycosyltransferase involved in cell wall biosynthesis